MQILVAVDHNPYSSHAVDEVAKLAANTWANVSLLGVEPRNTINGPSLAASDGLGPETLFSLRDLFLSHFNRETSPYTPAEPGQALTEVRKGIYEASTAPGHTQKKLVLRLRSGSPVKEVLSEAKEEESDLIVLGCDNSSGCGWKNDSGMPRKVASDAPCSVLIVKKRKDVKRIMCCLDHDRVSQASLEMINQLVTLHEAQLTIVGLSGGASLKEEVESKMANILRYYHSRGIEPWIEQVEAASLNSYIAEESRWGLMALWMGKQSIIEKALPRGKVDKLIKGGDASVLILR
ncbi:MAG: universal stress protein [Proteobacteria bacterium]|nr:universal stress protein [Pseudomonadota bacterium]